MRRSLRTGCAISVSLPPAIRRRNSRPGCTEKCSAGPRSPRRRTSRPTSDEKAMTGALTAIDCDVHPTVRDMTALLPYLDYFWRATVVERGINSLETVTYPPNAPLTARPQWRDKNGRAATTAAELTGHVCDRWQAGVAILNCLYGVGLIFSEDMAFAFTRALNDWVAKEWLDRDPRLRAPIVVPLQNTEYAVDEIERCAKDRRFVQILVLAMQETPLGRRHFWPIYAAAERHALPLGIQAGRPWRSAAA